MKKEVLQAFRFTSKSCTLMSPTKTELVPKTQGGGKQNAPEKESKGIKMKYEIVGIYPFEVQYATRTENPRRLR